MENDDLKSVPIVRHINMWTDEETRMLFDKYETYLPEVGPMKHFKNKKEMWTTIADEISGKSSKQCEERYKTVMRRRGLHSKTHMGFQPTVYKLDDSGEPVGSRKYSSKRRTLTRKRDANKSLQESLEEIAETREANKERRHREKMQALEKMQGLLERLLAQK